MIKPVGSTVYDYGASDCVMEDHLYVANPDLQMIPVVAG